MNRPETVDLLAMCAAYDQRTVGQVDVAAWQSVLEDIDSVDAQTAVKVHYAQTSRRIMPADVRHIVAAIRGARLAGVVEPVPAVDPDDVPRYLARLRADRVRLSSAPSRFPADLPRRELP